MNGVLMPGNLLHCSGRLGSFVFTMCERFVMFMKVLLSSRRALEVDGAKTTQNLHDVYMLKFYFLVNLPRIVAVFRPKKGIL